MPSAFITSHITRYPEFRSGSGNIATGFRTQSEELPSAWLVEDPSKFHIGQSSKLPLKSLLTIVLLLMLCVGSFPSSQIYSSFAHIGINAPVKPRVYYTIAQYFKQNLRFLIK